jgi:hypothetical protein
MQYHISSFQLLSLASFISVIPMCFATLRPGAGETGYTSSPIPSGVVYPFLYASRNAASSHPDQTVRSYAQIRPPTPLPALFQYHHVRHQHRISSGLRHHILHHRIFIIKGHHGPPVPRPTHPSRVLQPLIAASPSAPHPHHPAVAAACSPTSSSTHRHTRSPRSAATASV